MLRNGAFYLIFFYDELRFAAEREGCKGTGMSEIGVCNDGDILEPRSDGDEPFDLVGRHVAFLLEPAEHDAAN